MRLKTRFVKICGLLIAAAVASTASIALIGCSSAPATATELCPTADHPCKKPYPPGTEIEAKLKRGTAAILSGAATIECKKATVVDKTREEKGDPLKGKITSLTFAGCDTCEEFESFAIPWEASVERAEAGKGNGVLVVDKPELALFGCTEFEVDCSARASEARLEVIGGEPAKVVAKEEKFRLPGGLCGTTGALTATFEVVQPNPLFVGP